MEKKEVLEATAKECINFLKKHHTLAGKKVTTLEHEEFVPYNPSSGRYFGSNNKRMLMLATLGRGYKVPNYMTFSQIIKEGGRLKVNAKEVTCFSVKKRWIDESKNVEVTKDVLKMKKEGKDISKLPYRAIPTLTGYTVFNVQDVENLTKDFHKGQEPMPQQHTPHPSDKIKELLKANGSEVDTAQYGSGSYDKEADKINLPASGAKLSQEELYEKVTKLLSHAATRKKIEKPYNPKLPLEQDPLYVLTMTFLQSDINRALGLPSKLELTKAEVKRITAALKDKPAIYLDSSNSALRIMTQLDQTIEKINERRAEIQKTEQKGKEMEQSKDEGLTP